MTEPDVFELRIELDAARDSLERLVDQLCCALEADDWPWAAALLIAVKATSARVKHLRRALKLEVAA